MKSLLLGIVAAIVGATAYAVSIEFVTLSANDISFDERSFSQREEKIIKFSGPEMKELFSRLPQVSPSRAGR